MIREQIVEEARRWLDTPFQHQGRLIKIACDCVGLVAETGKACGLTTFDTTRYGRIPHVERMGALLDEHLLKIQVCDVRDGDIYWMAWTTRPHHLAIKTPIGIIHAFWEAGKVVEHQLDQLWTGRVRKAYRFPGVGD